MLFIILSSPSLGPFLHLQILAFGRIRPSHVLAVSLPCPSPRKAPGLTARIGAPHVVPQDTAQGTPGLDQGVKDWDEGHGGWHDEGVVRISPLPASLGLGSTPLYGLMGVYRRRCL